MTGRDHTRTGQPLTRTAARILEGLAVPYNTPTDVGGYIEVIAPGAFAAWIRTKTTAPLLLFHNRQDLNAIVGSSSVFREDTTGLRATFMLRDSAAAHEAAELAAAGVLALSIGFQAITQTEHLDPDGVLTITRTSCRLAEVSLTPTPAYPEAVVTSVRTRPYPPTTRATATEWLAQAQPDQAPAPRPRRRRGRL